MFDEVIHAFVLEPYGVEHTAWGFCHTRIRVALAMVECGALHNDASKAVQIDKIGEFFAISKGSRCSHNRVFQLQFSNFNA